MNESEYRRVVRESREGAVIAFVLVLVLACAGLACLWYMLRAAGRV